MTYVDQQQEQNNYPIAIHTNQNGHNYTKRRKKMMRVYLNKQLLAIKWMYAEGNEISKRLNIQREEKKDILC